MQSTALTKPKEIGEYRQNIIDLLKMTQDHFDFGEGACLQLPYFLGALS